MMCFLKLKCIHLALEMCTMNVIHFLQPLTQGRFESNKASKLGPFSDFWKPQSFSSRPFSAYFIY